MNLAGALTWAFEFEDQPYFAGFRVLATNGIDLPVLNVFRMFAKMTGKRVAAESDAAVPLDAILKGRARGNGQMPAELFTGKDAEDVAKFVAKSVGATAPSGG